MAARKKRLKRKTLLPMLTSLGIDLLILVGCVYLALLMRFAPIIPKDEIYRINRGLPWLLLSYAGGFLLFHLYDTPWNRCTNYQILMLALSNIVSCGFTFLWSTLSGLDLSMYYLLIMLMLSIVATCMGRLFARQLYENSLRRQKQVLPRAVLVGGRHNAAALLKALEGVKNVCALSDDVLSSGEYISGVPMMGKVHSLTDIALLQDATDAVLVPSLLGEKWQETITKARLAGLNVSILDIPSHVTQLCAGDARKYLRAPDLNDFFRQTDIKVDQTAIETALAEKTVLVVGAAGSIGRALCAEIMAYHPRVLIAMDIQENNLFTLECDIREKFGVDAHFEPILGSAAREETVREVFNRYAPEVVINAADYKNAAMMESCPATIVAHSVLGTQLLLQAAAEHHCKCFLHLSSNNAVNPESVLGACQRVQEYMVFSRKASENACVLRIGSVMGSTGSALPLFYRQLTHGMPITLTHREIERYLLSMRECVQLILQTLGCAQGKNLFLPDMVRSVQMKEMIFRLAEFCGLKPERDVDLKIIGLRKGEKLYEEMYYSGEANYVVSNEVDSLIRVPYPSENIAQHLSLLNDLLKSGKKADHEAARELLHKIVPSYREIRE